MRHWGFAALLLLLVSTAHAEDYDRPASRERGDAAEGRYRAAPDFRDSVGRDDDFIERRGHRRGWDDAYDARSYDGRYSTRRGHGRGPWHAYAPRHHRGPRADYYDSEDSPRGRFHRRHHDGDYAGPHCRGRRW
ncbi:MAG: hypothetical protein LBL72_02945 [Candidatus Accumulibacter sp.]|nr:hypothetical protein [Accumulibacter sp.]